MLRWAGPTPPRTPLSRWRSPAVGRRCPDPPAGYGLPLGSTPGRCGFGREVPDPATVRALFPSLRPVVQVDCVTIRAPWLDAGGDGWTAARRGRVVALIGSNLMKFVATGRPARSSRAQRRPAQRPDPFRVSSVVPRGVGRWGCGRRGSFDSDRAWLATHGDW